MRNVYTTLHTGIRSAQTNLILIVIPVIKLLSVIFYIYICISCLLSVVDACDDEVSDMNLVSFRSN
jgi:hypothetical protein